MRKIMAILILALFVASIVPATFAIEQVNVEERMRVMASSIEDMPSEAKIMRFILENKQETVELCVAKVMENYLDISKDRARVLCQRTMEVAVPVAISAKPMLLKSVAARNIANIRIEDFRTQMSMRLEEAKIKCQDIDNPEECKVKLDERVENYKRLSETALTKLQEFRVRKLDKVAQFQGLMQDDDFRKYSKENAFRARNITKGNLLKAKTDYLAAKERYQNARQKFNETRDNFLKAKEKIRQCQGDDSEECQNTREEINTNAKEHLLRIADVILEHLEKIKSSIESNNQLSVDEASEMLEKVKIQIAEIEQLKITIEGSESKEDIVKAGKQLREKWAKMHKHLGLISAKLVHARVGNTIVKSEQLEVKLERILERMAEAGYETSVMQGLIDEFNRNIELAKDDYKLAMEKFREAKAMEDPDKTLIEEAHQLMKDASEAIKEAQVKLREIVKAIKVVGAEDQLVDSADEAVGLVDDEIVKEEGVIA